MKKKLLCLMSACLLMLATAACQKEKAPEVTPITVTFMNADATIGSVSVNPGELIEGADAYSEVEGFTFEGWYGTPSFTDASFKDLSKDTFTEDTTLFGKFKDNSVEEDSRLWYVVGEGLSPILVASEWASATDDAVKEACQLMLTGNETNEFSITLDLYAGDKFQVIHDWQWNDQKGFGRFKDLDATQFESGGGLSGDANSANVSVLMDGNYTITLTTDPKHPMQDYMTIVRNSDPTQDASAVTVDEEPYVPSEATQIVMKGSWVSDWSENIMLERKEGNIFEGTKELEAGTELYFMVWENDADTGIGMNQTAVTDADSLALLTKDAYNVTVSEAGTYTFTVDADTLTIQVSK